MGMTQGLARFSDKPRRPWSSPLAACIGEPLDLFFTPADTTMTSKALDICGRCTVRQECLDAANAEEGYKSLRHGVKGGQTPEERRRIARLKHEQGRVRRKPGRPPKIQESA